MNKKNTSQIGRTLFETILVLIVMGIISIGVYKIYTIVVKKSASHNLSREINTRVVQLRHQAMTSQGIQPVTLEQALVRVNSKQSGSGLPIQVQPEAESFKLIIGSGDYPLKLNVCENVLNEYQLNSKICFLSGECKDLTGELIFSNICNPYTSNQDDEIIEPIDCGAHSYQVGRNCVCEDGYKNWTEGEGCSEGCFNNGSSCIPCTEPYLDWVDNESDCAECSNRKVVRYKFPYNGEEITELYCQIKQCPSGYFPDFLGDCNPCETRYSISYRREDWIADDEHFDGAISTIEDAQAACALCDSTPTPRIFDANRMLCLPDCTGENIFSDSSGSCRDCTYMYPVSASDEECARCGNLRQMFNGACAIKDCGPGKIHNTNGYCYSCSSVSSITNTGFNDCGNCTDMFTATNGNCYKCNYSSSIAANSDQCARCSSSREMYGAYCALKCNAGYYRANGTGSCTQCGNRQYVAPNKTSCQTCPAGQTHNSNHTGCQNCPVSTTLGDCGCSADKVPDGNGGCQPACTSYANSSTTVRNGYQISGTSCYCVNGYTLNAAKTACVEEGDTCAPGVCMTCTNGTPAFKPSGTSCVQAGISGTCTQYGQCIPSGTSCSSSTSCPSGYFCNYGGTYGNYGQGYSANICEKITAQTKTINGVTYYYNTLTDLKSWCRPADGGKNCTWGYLPWNGADSWCKSQGKRLLTMAELQSIRTNLASDLPNATNTYWCSDGSVNISNGSTGTLNRKDGYANAGAVVCR